MKKLNDLKLTIHLSEDGILSLTSPALELVFSGEVNLINEQMMLTLALAQSDEDIQAIRKMAEQLRFFACNIERALELRELIAAPSPF